MSILFSFDLLGKTASFRKPDINQVYLTYTFIPLPTVYGILGAIQGHGGYSSQYYKKSAEPEFYDKNKKFYIAIKPNNIKLNKTFITYNNFHGYGSNERGGNLQITEQFIVGFNTTIFVYSEDDSTLALFNLLKSSRTTFIPYLGKNEHLAELDNFKIYAKYNRIDIKSNSLKINSIVPLDESKVEHHTAEVFENEDVSIDESIQESANNSIFRIYENLPLSLNNNKYDLNLVVYSNDYLNPESFERNKYDLLFLKVDKDVLCFIRSK